MAVRRRNLSQVVADELLDRVRSGALKLGDRLPTENGLMEEFGVGRNAVREALQQLVAFGILDVRPGRGATIVSIAPSNVIDMLTASALVDEQTVDDLYAFRHLVEVEIAGRAAVRATPAEVDEVRACLDRFADVLRSGLPVYAADIELHRAIARASENAVYVRVLDALTDLLAATRRAVATVPGASERALADHARIVEAIGVHDEAAAREAMARHIRTAIDDMLRARELAKAQAAS